MHSSPFSCSNEYSRIVHSPHSSQSLSTSLTSDSPDSVLNDLHLFANETGDWTSLTGCALRFARCAERMSSSSICFMTFDDNFEIIKTSAFEIDFLAEIVDVLDGMDWMDASTCLLWRTEMRMSVPTSASMRLNMLKCINN